MMGPVYGGVTDGPVGRDARAVKCARSASVRASAAARSQSAEALPRRPLHQMGPGRGRVGVAVQAAERRAPRRGRRARRRRRTAHRQPRTARRPRCATASAAAMRRSAAMIASQSVTAQLAARACSAAIAACRASGPASARPARSPPARSRRRAARRPTVVRSASASSTWVPSSVEPAGRRGPGSAGSAPAARSARRASRAQPVQHRGQVLRPVLEGVVDQADAAARRVPERERQVHDRRRRGQPFVDRPVVGQVQPWPRPRRVSPSPGSAGRPSSRSATPKPAATASVGTPQTSRRVSAT